MLFILQHVYIRDRNKRVLFISHIYSRHLIHCVEVCEPLKSEFDCAKSDALICIPLELFLLFTV